MWLMPKINYSGGLKLPCLNHTHQFSIVWLSVFLATVIFSDKNIRYSIVDSYWTFISNPGEELGYYAMDSIFICSSDIRKMFG